MTFCSKSGVLLIPTKHSLPAYTLLVHDAYSLQLASYAPGKSYRSDDPSRKRSPRAMEPNATGSSLSSGINMDRRPSIPATDRSISPAPSDDHLLSATSTPRSTSALNAPFLRAQEGARRNSNSPLISPTPSLSRINTDMGDYSPGRGQYKGGVRDERERDVVSHMSRNGAVEWDQTPTQAGPSRQPYTYTESTPRAARPARELVYQAPAIPSRHASCELCALVEQCRLEGAGRTSSWTYRISARRSSTPYQFTPANTTFRRQNVEPGAEGSMGPAIACACRWAWEDIGSPVHVSSTWLGDSRRELGERLTDNAAYKAYLHICAICLGAVGIVCQ